MTTRKLEFAYPGEVRARIYYRVHQVGGPIYNYIDINEATASPPSSRAKVFKQGFTTEMAPFDTVDGVEPNPKTFEPDGWYQVSSDIGSFVEFPGQEKNIPAIVLSGAYDDTTTPLWKGTPGVPQDWDDEDGDRAAGRTLMNGSNGNPIPDTENPECRDPSTDSITPIREGVLFALSSGRAASDAGSQEVQRRNRGVFSQCIVEEQQGGGGGGGTCVPTLTPYYDHDGGNVRMGISQCDNRRWNVYQALGGGTTRRLGTLAAGQVFIDNSLALNEERTYKASTLSAGCGESALSAPVTVLHDDVVAPPAPQNFTASATPGHVTASWTAPIVGDIAGFKLLSASQSGGPYTPVHSGLLSISTTSLTFPAVGGGTYYVVGRTVDIAGNQSVYTQEVMVTVP